jgi:hypothetical protein
MDGITDEIITEYKNIHTSLFQQVEEGIKPDSQWFDDLEILPDNILRDDDANKSEIAELTPEEQQRYLDFLKFVSNAIKSAYSDETGDVVKLHTVNDLSPEELAEIQKKHAIYEEINKGKYSDKKPLYFSELMKYNDEFHKNHDAEIYFDNKKRVQTDPKDITQYTFKDITEQEKVERLLKFFDERIKSIDSCNVEEIAKKDAKLAEYLISQKAVMVELKDKGNELLSSWRAKAPDYLQFYQECAEKIVLSYELYSLPDTLSDEDVKKYEGFFNAEENQQDFEMMRANLGEDLSQIWIQDKDDVWRLTEDFKINYGKKYNNNKYRQLVLGFGNLIKKYVGLPHFYWCIKFLNKKASPIEINLLDEHCKDTMHIKFNYGNLTIDYLLVYLFSYLDSNYPILFNIPTDDLFYQSNESKSTLSIKKKQSYTLQKLFLEEIQFLGLTTIKYKYSHDRSNDRIWFILYFKINGYIILIGINKKPIQFLLYKSNITYNEFSQLLNYLSVKTYIFKNNKKAVYYSRTKKPVHEHINPINISLDYNYDKSLLFELRGGGNNNFKLQLSNNINLIDDNISSIYYNIFDDYQLKNINKHNSYTIFYNKSKLEYIYNYYFSNEGKKNNNEILKYKPISIAYFRLLEVYLKYFKTEKNNNILSIDYIPTFIEILNQQESKIAKFTSIIKSQDKRTEYNNYLKNIKNIYNHDIINIKDNEYSILDLDETKLPQQKQDLVIYSNYTRIKGFKLNYGFINDINLFLGLIFILKHTTDGGHAILNISHIYNKNQADIYIILKRYFEFSELYYPEISNMYKHSGTIAIFKGFKGCPKRDLDELLTILEKIKREYPNGSSDLNIYDPEIRKRCFVSKPMKPVGQRSKYITDGYLDIPSTDAVYDEIREFNTQRYFKQYLFVKKLDELADIPASKLPQLPTQEQITASMLYLRKWNIPHYPFKTEEYLNETFLTDIYENIVPIHYKLNTPYQSFILGKYKPLEIKGSIKRANSSYNKTKKHSRRTSKTKKLSVKSTKSLKAGETSSIAGLLMQLDLDEIDDQLSDIYDKYEVYKSLEEELSEDTHSIERVGLYIDSRRDFSETDPQKQIAKYDKYKKRYRFYNPSDRKLRLTNVIESEYRTGVISQAYLKMWEILERCQLITAKKHRGGFRSFHLCEAPGMFIRATHDYCMTHGIKRHEWNGQSLNPREGGFSDNYGYIRKYPRNWVWGDITKLSTVRKYIREGVANGINLITSDCGLPWGDPRYYNAACCSLMAMLMLLPVGGDLVYKIILPAKPVLWNLAYICYQYFQDVEFYKPVQNYQSREFYIIGKLYLGIPQELVMRFEHIFENYSDDIDLYGDQYPEPFVLQMKRFNKIFAGNYTNAIEKQIFVMDNAELIEGKRIEKLIFNGIKEKNRKWVKDFGFRSITNPKDKF